MFITPAELAAIMERHGLGLGEVTGLGPRARPLAVLRSLAGARRGRITYGELSRRLDVGQVKSTAVSYMGSPPRHNGNGPFVDHSPAASGILGIVSDNYIRLIPADKNWQPAPEAAASVAAYVTGLFSGSDDDVEEVSGEFYDEVTLIDAGENTTRITCPRCGGDISLEWFLGLVEEHGESIGDRDVTVPCCHETVPLDVLRYDWPVGFARFEVCAMNPTRDKYELDAAELTQVAALLGHPVLQILAHY